MTARKSIYDILGAPVPFDPQRKYTSSYCISPLILGLARLLLACYAFVTLFFQLAYESIVANPDQRWSARHHLSYFTNLCYWGLAFYLLMSGLHTMAWYYTDPLYSRGRWRRPPSGSVHQDTPYTMASPQEKVASQVGFWRRLDLNRWPRPLQAANAVLYSSIMTFPPLVTIVFWSILYTNPWWPDEFDGWKNISVHALNTLPTLLTILFTCTPIPKVLHLLCLLILLALYLSLAYLTKATAGFYPYSFLNPHKHSNKIVAAYCIGIAVGACVVFAVVCVAIWAREQLAKRKGWHATGDSVSSAPEQDRIDIAEGTNAEEVFELEEVITEDEVIDHGIARKSKA